MNDMAPSRRYLIAGLAATFVGGCGTSPPTRRFLLEPRPAAASLPFAQRIAIARVGIAKYLDQPQIVRRGGGYELVFAELERWGEDMADMVARVLAEDLAQRLPNSEVFVGNGAATVSADASLELFIRRFDADSDGTVVLAARWTIRRGSAAARLGSESIAERTASPTTSNLVAAMSNALAKLADRLATMLAV